MQLTILGSAAAEGWPALFCECETCREARRLGGRNVRRRTAYRLGEKLLIDFGPDALWQANQFGIDLAAIDDILFTHSHSDHLNTLELSWRRRGYSSVSRTLGIHGNAHVLARIRAEIPKAEESFRLALREIRPGDRVEVGEFAVTALEAQHASPEEDALNYVLEKDGRGLLIGNDTGWWPDRTWQQIEGLTIHLAILECTYGLLDPDAVAHHLGVAATVRFRDELRRRGALAESATVVANHFSHNGRANYDRLCEWFAPHGIMVGYDGMVLEV